MFERFTDRARRVVVLAQEESRLLNHNYIGTEHLLLGLVHEGEGVAAQALVALDIRLEAVRHEVEQLVGLGESAPSGHIPFTTRAKKVLELALREALQLGHNYIGTEHILLGLVREGEGVAAQVLVKLGADTSRVRQQVIQILAGYQATGVASERLGVGAGARAHRPAAPAGAEVLEHAPDRLVLRRFTVSSCRVLLLAESEALRLGHPTVGVEHLILGLLAEDEGLAAAALASVGVDLGGARALAEESLGQGRVAGPSAGLPGRRARRRRGGVARGLRRRRRPDRHPAPAPRRRPPGRGRAGASERGARGAADHAGCPPRRRGGSRGCTWRLPA